MRTNKALIVVVALSIAACADFKIDNKPPIAKAVGKVDGNALDPKVPPGYMGQPVVLTLDGTASSDSDGKIIEYIWMRSDMTSQPDAGGGAAPSDSIMASGATATVNLNAAGKYQFSLWVRDNDKMVSAPSTVKVEVVTPYKPDMACLGYYNMQPNADCQQCLCQPNAMGGCLDELSRCLANPDAAFVPLCKALVECAIAKGCSGSACFAPALCMAEINAAAMYMGGTTTTCSDTTMAATNPCAAASTITTCQTMTSMCIAICGG